MISWCCPFRQHSTLLTGYVVVIGPIQAEEVLCGSGKENLKYISSAGVKFITQFRNIPWCSSGWIYFKFLPHMCHIFQK
jgi:hypothetical protein